MRVFVSALSLLLAIGASAPAPAGEPTHRRRRSSKQRPLSPRADLEPHLVLAAPGNVPPGAQLTPDRVIEAPQATGPGTDHADRVSVPARDMPPRRRHRDPAYGELPYSRGPDPGRDLEPEKSLSPWVGPLP